MSDHQHSSAPDHPASTGSIERTLAGNADLQVGAVIREAWERTAGIKGIVVCGTLLIFLGLMLVTYAAEALLGSPGESLTSNLVGQLAAAVIVYPFMAGVFMLGLRQSIGEPVRFEQQFAYFGALWPVVWVGLLQSAATTLGLMLLIVPGVYLMFALSLAIPLKVERNLPVLECLQTSLKLVNRKFLEVVALSVISGLLMLLGIFSLIGWIWTLPWVLMIYAIIYRQLAGIAGAGSVDPGAPRGPAQRSF